MALEFPKFRDGRAFSWARMLRTRFGFKGEVRAVGDFLFDQIAYQRRVGFDAWQVPDDFALADFARALADTYAVMERGEVILAGEGADMVESEVRRHLTV